MMHIAASNNGMCLAKPIPLDLSPEAIINVRDYWAVDDDYCKNELLWSYARCIAMMLGDFSLSEYEDNVYMCVLFIVFGCVLCVVILNLMVAIVSESYDKSRSRSDELFGWSRMQAATQQLCI